MLRFCERGENGGHYVLAGDAQLLRTIPSGPDAGRREYACHQHIRDDGLLPDRRAAFIGCRDTAPAIATQESP